MGDSGGAAVYAVSDLHVGHPLNRELLLSVLPHTPDDWLVIAGDVAERLSDIEWVLGTLAARFDTVVWTPGNHELWTLPGDPCRLRGVERYGRLVEMSRNLGVLTPEDPYPVWRGPGGPAVIAATFLLYDYTFRPAGAESAGHALDAAAARGVVCTDEVLLHPDPYPSREAWCEARVAETERRLATLDRDVPVVIVNHHPLIRESTAVLHEQDFALWCGTERTGQWHRRFNVAAVVYGHLHVSRTEWHDGVPFMEVSFGYAREWSARPALPSPTRVLPLPVADHAA